MPSFPVKLQFSGMARAEMRAMFVAAMHQLLETWDQQTPDERLVSIQAALGAVTAPSMPKLEVNPTALGPSHHGQLDFTRWQIDINESLLAGEMDTVRMAELSNTLYHEARHGEQWSTRRRVEQHLARIRKQ